MFFKNPKVRCAACGQKVEGLAGACPQCHGVTGFRPEILNILGSRYTADKGAVFRFSADTVSGKAPRFPFGWTLLVCIFIAIAGTELLRKYPEHEFLILCVFFPANLAIPVCLIGFIAGKFMSKGARWFELKFSAEGPIWSSGDPGYWVQVKEKLELASRGELKAPIPETPEVVIQRMAGLAFTAGAIQMVRGLAQGGQVSWVGGASFVFAMAFVIAKGPKSAAALTLWSLVALGFSLYYCSQGLEGLGAWAWFLPFVAGLAWYLAKNGEKSPKSA